MDTDVVCPDCGKVIAPPGAVDSAARCRCADAPTGPRITPDAVPLKPALSIPIAVPRGENAALLRDRTHAADALASSSATDDDGADSSSATAQQQQQREKKCYMCGKSLQGRTRLKDHLGRYWCKECSDADARAKKHEEELRCADCSRVFPPNKLMYFQTERVCATCFKAREKALEKKIKKAAAEKTYTAQEWKQIKIMAAIAGGLIALGALGWLMS